MAETRVAMSPRCRARAQRAVLAVLCASACSSLQVETTVRDGRPLGVEAVAVFPFSFRWSEPAYRSFELSQEVVTRLMTSERFAVFGPGEFQIYRSSEENLNASTNLGSILASRHLRPTDVLAVKPWAEKQVQSDVKQLYDMAGHAIGQQRNELVTVVLHLDVGHGDVKGDVAEFTTKIDLDPFAEREDSDPMPEVTRALRDLADRVPRELDRHDRIATREVHRSWGFAYLWVPKAVFDYEEPGRESLEKWLAVQDMLTREATRLACYKFFTPNETDRTLNTMLKLPGGLWVTQVDHPEDGLLPGDVILEAGAEAATPQAIGRRLRAAATGSTIPLLVRRQAERVTVNLPVRD
jgi:hypothetical protein